MICPVSAITMSKVWDTVVTDRLSRDTMSEREVKRRQRPKGKQASKGVGIESQEPTAEDLPQTPTADNKSGAANE
jgi:formate hydrogenlyase subunit 6/NADH:ubiquinone oxidoreductase subunit I